jgi:hypothetical protein
MAVIAVGLAVSGWGVAGLLPMTVLAVSSPSTQPARVHFDGGDDDVPVPRASTLTTPPVGLSPPPGTGPTARPAAPIRIQVPRIGVDARVVRLELRDDQTLEVPADPWQAGWWAGGPNPGERGAAVLVGHRDSAKGPALLYDLAAVEIGDEINVEDSNGIGRSFSVYGTQDFDKSSFPSDRVYGETPEQELRLITCSGEYEEDQGGYQRNLVVFARAIESSA